MRRPALLIFSVLLLTVGRSDAQDSEALTPEQQSAFLAERTSGGMMGTFDSYCSFLFAINDVAIHTESNEINQTRLNSPFPESYQPTWKEVFDCIARQTKSSWKYDPKRNYWVFAAPPMPVPFEVKLAKGWTREDRGMYVFHKPESAPVGMDIYMLGTYSFPENKKASFAEIREKIALHMAGSFKKDVTLKDMSEVKAGKYDALYFKMSVPQSGITWRQWVLVESGQAFAIVSAIKPDHEQQIIPDVEAMVKSFTLKSADKKTTKPNTGDGK